MESLRTFITSRELEKALPAKIAHLKAHEEKCELHFFEENMASLWFRWDGKKSSSQISLWESGYCDVEIADGKSGDFLPYRHKRCSTKEEFYSMLDEMIAAISKHEERA
jgi:hypothetical protein